MIVVAGIPDERPMARVIAALESLGARHHVLDQRRFADIALDVHIADGGALDGRLTIGANTLSLPSIEAMYLRLMDDRHLPGIDDLLPAHATRQRCRRLHELLQGYADHAPGRILNRPRHCASNHSKPWQTQAARAAGFAIPDSLVTNDPELARAFIEGAWADGGDVIYKSVSGVRSIVQRVQPRDLERLHLVRWCPTQFQRFVQGVDLRVHVVGNEILAARIESDATDYRYASRESCSEPRIVATTLDDATQERCLALASRLALPLAGIDLRQTPQGTQVCFEVNPSPAFSFYEAHAGLPIAAAIARHLVGRA